jgi:antitoxin MazE
MITRVRKWGNSLGLRIPKSFAKEARIELSSEVDLALTQGRLVIIPIRRKTLTLKDLLGRVTRKNLHGEVDAGRPAGRELL